MRHRIKRQAAAAAGVILLCMSGCISEKNGGIRYASSDPVGTQAVCESSTAEHTEEKKVVIYICGAVCVPGVYELSASARVVDCVSAAGGFTEDALLGTVNLARTVNDGEQITIPFQSESGEYQEAAEEGEKKVSINRASKEELMTLSGIGEAKAEQIIAYREANGDFQTEEDIMLVPGIKQSVYDKIKDDITVR